MTMLLIARHVFLAGLLMLVASYVWLMLTGRD
jgi:hypothetical protein